MSSRLAGRPLPSPWVALVGYTLRACLPARRRIAVVLPCAAALFFGWLSSVLPDVTREEAFAGVASQSLFGLILPLTCLVIGDAVLGADVRAGTFQLTWLSPVGFPSIVLGRWLGGWLIALVTLVPAFTLAAPIAGVSEAAGPMALAAAVGAAAYIALFVMIGVLVRRGAVWSLAVVILGERLLGNYLDGIGQLSPLWQAQQTFAGLWDDPWSREELLRSGMPEGWSAVIRLVVITVVCLAVAAWRIGHMRPVPSDE